MSERKYRAAGIPRRFWGMDFGDYEIPRGDSALEASVDALRAYVSDFRTRLASGVGQTLSGPPGGGKTMLACIVGMRVIDKGFRVAFMTLPQWIHLLQREMTLRQMNLREEWESLDDKIRKVRKFYDLLIMDDVGKEHLTASGFAQDEFDYLIRRRYDRGLPTILTSNHKKADWAKEYSQAMESFLHEASPIIAVTPVKGDWRKG